MSTTPQTLQDAPAKLQPIDLREVSAGLVGFHSLCRSLALAAPGMTDDALRVLDSEARACGGSAWIPECASDYQAWDRIRQRIKGDGAWKKKNRDGCASVYTMMAEEAALRGKCKEVMFKNARIWDTFFKDGIPDVGDLLDKSFYITALPSPDPHAAIRFLKERKGQLATFPASDARRELTQNGLQPRRYAPRQQAPVAPVAPTKPRPLCEHIRAGSYREMVPPAGASLIVCNLIRPAVCSDGQVEVDYVKLGEWARMNLLAHGSCVILLSPGAVISAGEVLQRHLTPHWLLCVRTSDTGLFDPDNVERGWLAALWLVKCERGPLRVSTGAKLPDTFASTAALYDGLVNVLTGENDLILDPFMRGVDVAATAIRAGRRFLGFAQDEGTRAGLSSELAERV